MREDYSEDGNAWDYFSHDQARSRAYHWGEDGLAGFPDYKQHPLLCARLMERLCDPILKERFPASPTARPTTGRMLRNITSTLTRTPTHSYMKWLYKYPQAAYPYGDLIKTNKGA